MTDNELKFLDFILPILSKSPNHESISDLDRKYSKLHRIAKQDYKELKMFVDYYNYKYFIKDSPMYAIRIIPEWKEKIDIHGSLSKLFEFEKNQSLMEVNKIIHKSDFKMRKKSIKKVIKIINESSKNEISLNDVLDKSDIPKDEIIEIFSLLIDANKVININSKSSIEIGKKDKINYNSFFSFFDNNRKTITPTIAPTNTTGSLLSITFKIIIGVVIGFVVILLWSLFGDYILYLIRGA